MAEGRWCPSYPAFLLPVGNSQDPLRSEGWVTSQSPSTFQASWFFGSWVSAVLWDWKRQAKRQSWEVWQPQQSFSNHLLAGSLVFMETPEECFPRAIFILWVIGLLATFSGPQYFFWVRAKISTWKEYGTNQLREISGMLKEQNIC